MQDLKEIIDDYLFENKKNILREDLPLDMFASACKPKRKSGKIKSDHKLFHAYNYSTSNLILNYRHISKMILYDKQHCD